MKSNRREEVVRIARRLKAARMHSSPPLSQAAVSRAINISVRTLQDWEQGKHPPPAPRIADLAKLYKISANFLVGIGPDEVPVPTGPRNDPAAEHIPELERSEKD